MITVYHGSTSTIEHPLANAGRDNLDFGKGFYVTTGKEQAEKWARTVAKRQTEATAVLNVYDFDKDRAVSEGYRYLRFEEYDREWLEFIADSRKGGRKWEAYDIIEGGIANDRVIDTIEAYLEGLTPLDIALGLLSQHRPNNQVAILNQKVIDGYMTFRESIILTDRQGV